MGRPRQRPSAIAMSPPKDGQSFATQQLIAIRPMTRQGIVTFFTIHTTRCKEMHPGCQRPRAFFSPPISESVILCATRRLVKSKTSVPRGFVLLIVPVAQMLCR
jgi:hypothetical protein